MQRPRQRGRFYWPQFEIVRDGLTLLLFGAANAKQRREEACQKARRTVRSVQTIRVVPAVPVVPAEVVPVMSAVAVSIILGFSNVRAAKYTHCAMAYR